MDAERLFTIANAAVLPGWLCLVFLPRWRWTQSAAALLAVLMSLLYLGLFIAHIGEAEGGFGSLQGVAAFMQNPRLLLLGWVHYLAFDLFVGAWEVRDSQRLGVPHLVVVPCLALTLMAGPIGFLAYSVARGVKRRSLLFGPAVGG